MRPDGTCETGEQTLVSHALLVPGSRRPPCSFAYRKGATYQCGLLDRLKAEAPKTPRDLMKEGIFTNALLFEFFLYCVRLRTKNPGATCYRCGECCKMWSPTEHALDPKKPCKGLGTLDTPYNPCTKLIDLGVPNPSVRGRNLYACSVYSSRDYVRDCDAFPRGTEFDLFDQLLDGVTPGGLKKLRTCPDCVYEFQRVL